MKLAIITPIPHLSESEPCSNIFMVLGHLLKNPLYRDYYNNLRNINSDAYVLCDNSANEGFMLKGQELLNLAESVNANEIIAPDKYHDAKTTMDETFSFLNNFYDEGIAGKFNVMAVPQGNTIEEYLECYEAFVADKRINVIGVGYRNLIPALMQQIFDMTDEMLLSIPNIEQLTESLEDNCYNYTLSRLYFFLNYVKFKSLAYHKKSIHLLGLYNPYELKLLNQCLSKNQLKHIRSCDSAAPWQAAQVGVRFNEKYGTTIKPKMFLDFDMKSDGWQKAAYEHNIKLLRKWAENTSTNGK